MNRGTILALATALGAAACSGRSDKPVAAPKSTESVPVNSGIDSPSDADKPAPSLASKDSKLVARTLTKVSALRGITASRPVPGQTLARGELVAAVKEKALREYPPEALAREGHLLQLMGFAPADFDYLGAMMRLLEAQLEGFYEPKNGTMYLAADLRGEEAQATLAHELVHALQDQNWDLKKRSDYRPGHSDETVAVACLAEGDATSLMMDFVMAPQNAMTMPDEMLRELIRTGVSGSTLEGVPHLLKASLVSPYAEGIGFVHALRRKGGWSAVDKAWERVPISTEQILHADKWEAGETPLVVAAPTGAALGEGFVREDEDTMGELGFALALSEWMAGSDARIAASGWGGDRSAVFRKGEEIATAIHFRYDDGGKGKDAIFAERAMSKIVPAMKKQFGNPAVSDASTLCFERKDTGPLLFARKEREVVLVAGPAKIGSDRWSSTGTCAVAKKWAQEIVAQK